MGTNERKFEDRDGKVHVWQLGYYPADEGIDLFAEIGPVVAPLLGAAVDSAGGKEATGLGGAMSDAFRSLVRAGGSKLIVRILAGSTRDGVLINEAQFNLQFAGNYGEMARAVWAMIDHNYRSFTDGFDLAALTRQVTSQDTTQSAQ